MNPSCIVFARQIGFELHLQSIYVKKSGEFRVIRLERAVVPNAVAQPLLIFLYLTTSDNLSDHQCDRKSALYVHAALISIMPAVHDPAFALQTSYVQASL